MSMTPAQLLQGQSPASHHANQSQLMDKFGRDTNQTVPQWTIAGNVAAGAAAGTAPTLAVSPGRSVNDANGSIDITAGTSPGANGILLTCTFTNPYGPNTPKVLLTTETGSGLNAIPAGTQLIAGSVTTTGFTVTAIGTALTAGSIYRVAYEVLP